MYVEFNTYGWPEVLPLCSRYYSVYLFIYVIMHIYLYSVQFVLQNVN